MLRQVRYASTGQDTLVADLCLSADALEEIVGLGALASPSGLEILSGSDSDVAPSPMTPAVPPPASPCPPHHAEGEGDDDHDERQHHRRSGRGAGSADRSGRGSPFPLGSASSPSRSLGVKFPESSPDPYPPPSPDYYAALGLSSSCSDDDIRRAYRSLAKANHPDRNQQSAALEKFKLVTEAYDVLSDPARRADYDERLVAERRPRGDSPSVAQQTYRLLERIFGPRPGSIHSRSSQAEDGLGGGVEQSRPAPVEKDLLVSLEELTRGGRKCLRINKPDGSGDVLQIDIKPGWPDGTRILFPRKGGQVSLLDSRERDLVFIVRQAPHAFYSRSGNDLLAQVQVPLVTLLCGGSVQLPAFAGRSALNLKLSPGCNIETPLVIANQGMPSSSGGPAGALRVSFKLVMPQRLSDSQREQLRSILSDTS